MTIPFMSESAISQKYLDVGEAAQLLRYTKKYIYKLVYLRAIPHYKLGANGSRLYFLESELLAWIERGRVAPDYELAAQAEALVARTGRPR